ncbi:MAG: isocitrate lyase/phosphoenolpyruvate mutase family protein [Hyphomonadaceae bacterium]
MSSQADKVTTLRALHQPGKAFIIPNPWDEGSARMLEGLGFSALATTSSGFAMTLGRRDYGITREEAISHAARVASAVDIPVSADLENGFGSTPEDAGETIRLAAQTELAGGSIEDSTGDPGNPIMDMGLAVERIDAAVKAAKSSPNGFVLTARAEAFLYGDADLDEVISRLQAFEKAGADVLFAPGLPDMDAVRAVCKAVSKPVNVIVIGGLRKHSVAEFSEAGAARLSIGGALAANAYGTLADAATMLSDGSFDSLSSNPAAAKAVSEFLR